MDIEAQPFDLRECVESALDLIGSRAAEKHLDIAYVFEGEVPAAILGDVTRLRQVLLNLLANASRFTERGEIRVTAEIVGEEVLVSVAVGRRPQIREESVCLECKRRGTVCVMVAQGLPCMGPVTRTGCGALCPSYDRGCYACFGPMERGQN